MLRLLHSNGVGAGTPAPAAGATAGVAAWIRLGIGLCGRLIADGHRGQTAELAPQAVCGQLIGQGFHRPGLRAAGNEVLDGEGVAGGPGPRRVGQDRRHALRREMVGIDIAPHAACVLVLEGHIEHRDLLSHIGHHLGHSGPQGGFDLPRRIELLICFQRLRDGGQPGFHLQPQLVAVVVLLIQRFLLHRIDDKYRCGCSCVVAFAGEGDGICARFRSLRDRGGVVHVRRQRGPIQRHTGDAGAVGLAVVLERRMVQHDHNTRNGSREDLD